MAIAQQVSFNDRGARNEDLVWNQIEGEVVMHSINNGSYYGLDAIGSRVWLLLEQPCIVCKLCETLQEEFEVDRDTCQRDTLEFLNALHQEQLLRIMATPTA